MFDQPNDDLEFMQEASALSSRYTFGDPLKIARTKTNLTLERAASDLNIRLDYLRAIEQNNPSNLPEPVFTMGFIRSYGKYLHLDAQGLVDLYKREVLGLQNECVHSNIPPQTHISFAPRNWALMGAAGLIAVTYAVWFFVNRIPSTPELSQAATSETSTTSDRPLDSKINQATQSETQEAPPPDTDAPSQIPAALKKVEQKPITKNLEPLELAIKADSIPSKKMKKSLAVNKPSSSDTPPVSIDE